MQTGQRIWRDCGECSGEGLLYMHPNFSYPTNVESSSPIDCYFCNGLGIKPWGWLRDDKEETMPGEEA